MQRKPTCERIKTVRGRKGKVQRAAREIIVDNGLNVYLGPACLMQACMGHAEVVIVSSQEDPGRDFDLPFGDIISPGMHFCSSHAACRRNQGGDIIPSGAAARLVH